MTTQELLTAARLAYHNLTVGGQVRVFVDQNGERVEYTAARRSDLLAYITGLEAQLGLFTPRPIIPFF